MAITHASFQCDAGLDGFWENAISLCGVGRRPGPLGESYEEPIWGPLGFVWGPFGFVWSYLGPILFTSRTICALFFALAAICLWGGGGGEAWQSSHILFYFL